VRGVKETLESSCFRLKFIDDVNNSAVNRLETLGDGIGGFRSNGTTTDKNTIGAIAVDDAVTSNAGTAINAENPHCVKKPLQLTRIPRYQNWHRRAERHHALPSLP